MSRRPNQLLDPRRRSLWKRRCATLAFVVLGTLMPPASAIAQNPDCGVAGGDILYPEIEVVYKNNIYCGYGFNATPNPYLQTYTYEWYASFNGDMLHGYADASMADIAAAEAAGGTFSFPLFNITIMDETGGEWIDSPPVPDPGGLDGGYLGGDLLGLITGGSTPPTQGGFAAPNSPLLQARRIIPEELT